MRMVDVKSPLRSKCPPRRHFVSDSEEIRCDFSGVLLADDHQEVIARVCGTLGEEFEIVATVENGNQAVSAVLTLDPDVLVTDISVPLLNGLEAAKRIQKVNRHAKIILTVHEDPDFIAAAFKAGASG
jgi:DNA-binding NarL/FixJ family response regulator